MIPEENATVTYLIPQPFEEGLKLLRKAMAKAQLRITGELNMSSRIERSLRIQTAPCVVIFACPGYDSDGFPFHPIEAGLSPLHVVVSARGSQTEIHILRVLPRGEVVEQDFALADLGELQAGIAKTIESIGMRVGLIA